MVVTQRHSHREPAVVSKRDTSPPRLTKKQRRRRRHFILLAPQPHADLWTIIRRPRRRDRVIDLAIIGAAQTREGADEALDMMIRIGYKRRAIHTYNT